MSATDVLREIQWRGIILEAQGNQIRYRAPKGTLTPDLLEAMKWHKGQIIAALACCLDSDKCGGCYSIGVIDSRERFIHPPKGKPIDWTAWEPETEKLQ